MASLLLPGPRARRLRVQPHTVALPLGKRRARNAQPARSTFIPANGEATNPFRLQVLLCLRPHSSCGDDYQRRNSKSGCEGTEKYADFDRAADYDRRIADKSLTYGSGARQCFADEPNNCVRDAEPRSALILTRVNHGRSASDGYHPRFRGRAENARDHDRLRVNLVTRTIEAAHENPVRRCPHDDVGRAIPGNRGVLARRC